MEKPTPAALAAFDQAFPPDARAVRKQMFGMPAGFVNGNMFLGVFSDGVVLRLPDDKLAALRALDGVSQFEPMPGRPWKDYVHASATRWGGSEELGRWALAALDHTVAMPVKEAKKEKGGKKR